MKKNSIDMKKQAGMTLLEVTASLAIGAIIIMGALALYSGGSASASSNQLVQEMSSVRSAIVGLYMGQGSYGTASINGSLVSGGKIPAQWTGSGTTITNEFGGAVVATGATNSFNVTSGSIPKSVCVGSLAAASQGWTQVGVGATAAAAITAAAATPITPAAAATACSATTQFVAFIGS